MFMAYSHEPMIEPTIRRLRELAIADGFPGLYIIFGRGGVHETYEAREDEHDHGTWENAMRNTQPFNLSRPSLMNKTMAYPYPRSEITLRPNRVPSWCHGETAAPAQEVVTEIPGLCIGFDNTPRRVYEHSKVWLGAEGGAGHPVASVARYKESLHAILHYQACCRGQSPPRRAASVLEPGDGNDRFIAVNAWNEWAESMALEPSDVYGRGYLEATREVRQRVVAEGCAWHNYQPYETDAPADG